MFISSCRLFYKEACDDPIFPADYKWPPGSDLWINNDSRARSLACVDWIEVCTHDGRCLPPYQEGQNVDENYVFTRFALNKSTAFHSIYFRGATGLDAQYKVEGDTSLPLAQDPPQWVVESWRLFNTSLSRIQYDALDIANGTSWDKSPLYVQKMPRWVQGKLCGIFTFQLPKGYDNVRIGVEIAVLLIPVAAYLMGWQTKEEFSEEKKRSGHFDGMTLIGIEWLAKRLKTRTARKHKRLSEEAEQNPQHADQATESQADPESLNGPNYGSINTPRPADVAGDQNANVAAGAEEPDSQGQAPIQFGASVSSTFEAEPGKANLPPSPSDAKLSDSAAAAAGSNQQTSSKDP